MLVSCETYQSVGGISDENGTNIENGENLSKSALKFQYNLKLAYS